jgi:hypothetical protein
VKLSKSISGFKLTGVTQSEFLGEFAELFQYPETESGSWRGLSEKALEPLTQNWLAIFT